MSIKSNLDTDLVEQLANLDVSVDQKRNHSKEYHRLTDEQYKVMQKISKAHIDSFDYMVDRGLNKGIKNLHPAEIEIPGKGRLTIQVTRITIETPLIHKDSVAKTKLLYPAECRIKGTTYKAPLTVSFSCQLDNEPIDDITEVVGDIPIMLKSKKCNLVNLSPKDLVKRYEDAEELGGYFIINGNEKVIRFLIAQRRNYPMSIKRTSWKSSGQLFTEYGILIRCVRSDEIGTNMVLHYLNNGTARLRCFYQKQIIYLPIIMVLKALTDMTDVQIFQELVKGHEEDLEYANKVKYMLLLVQQEGLLNQQQIKAYIGEKFRARTNLPARYSDIEVTDYLLKECVATHLTEPKDKFDLLVFMTKKLYRTVKGECALENPDNPMFHELYLSGHIYFTLLLERLDNFLENVGKNIKKTIDIHGSSGKEFDFNKRILRKALSMQYSYIVKPLEHLLSTGNLISKTGIGLMQSTGLSVVAEKINFWRFLAHFRSVHRGASFTERRTTEARKLYPEAWGFMCPAHTPDGEPCGLLNHLADQCFITNYQPTLDKLDETLVKYGMRSKSDPSLSTLAETYTVLIDGNVVGYVHDSKVVKMVRELRLAKCSGTDSIPPVFEIGFVPKTNKATQFPGVFIFTNPTRMVRPVKNIEANALELIGTFEQVYLDIALNESEMHKGVTTHLEVSQIAFLSILASLVPYPDFNQSPRNMYACQMGKQTMGTASHTLKYRSDTKMYSLLYPQSPLVRPKSHDTYHLDDYPIGTNAVVAVISYTGYDMEDALILNKHAVERGFKHGSITKTIRIDIKDLDKGSSGTATNYVFGRKKTDDTLKDKIDEDGLPRIGNRVEYDDPICSFIDQTTGLTKVEKYKSTETAFITDVKILGRDNGKEPLEAISITFYIPRRPIVGDKFANRHGQKGVCSFLWPCENMPFTGEGIVPDVVFNPHGYPSRMTIGMMLESMAGKSSSLHGHVHDATPFIFSEDEKASEYYGDILEKAGYNFYGTEMMYSGVDGRPLRADIFIGVIFYIRLRHMVGDKYQVRSTGPIDSLTHQPIKGRKRCGGIRFGEMERDSLLSHGASFLIHDRLYNQSDKTKCFGCAKCGSIISTSPLQKESFEVETVRPKNQIWFCTVCNTSAFIKALELPYALRYLVAELAFVNIKLQFTFE